MINLSGMEVIVSPLVQDMPKFEFDPKFLGGSTRTIDEFNRWLLERINLRLSPEVLEAIDAECSRRAGSVSRNTWITEAVTERLARLASSSRPQGAGGANG